MKAFPFLHRAVGSGAGHFQADSLIIEPSHDRTVANLQLTMHGQIAVKLPSDPMSLIGFFRVENNRFVLLASHCSNLLPTSRMWPLHQPINRSLIEPSHPSGNGVSSHVKQPSILIVRHSHNQGLYRHHAYMASPVRRRFCSRFPLHQNAILSVRHAGMARRPPTRSHPSQEHQGKTRLLRGSRNVMDGRLRGMRCKSTHLTKTHSFK
jgi:hypothetical protein